LLRLRILRLRALRGIPAPPIPVQPHLAPAQPNLMDIEIEMLGSIDESYEIGYPSAIKSFV
ncbi:hypothetical protein H4I95_10893, partial [Botrytis cinerea]